MSGTSPTSEASPTLAASETPAPSVTPSASAVPSASPTASRTPAPADWREMPVIPQGLSPRALEIYRRGIALGNNPRAFSKVGDCETQAVWFLADFDAARPGYNLGPYGELQQVIDYYRGSFRRLSLAAKPSFNAASVLSPLWRDAVTCADQLHPLDCEYHAWKPSLALVMLGTNDSPRPGKFEGNLRKVIEFSIEQGVLPVLVTKADNLEGDGSINAAIVRLALEYELPLWNYWRAVQGLPGGGMQPDGAHLTLGPNDFGDAAALQTGWAVRNLTALQALQAVRQGE